MDIKLVAALVTIIACCTLVIIFGFMRINRRLHREIRERKQIETELRLSREALTESQHTAHIGWWKWSLADNDIEWSDEIYRITGLKPESFKPTKKSFAQTVHQDDRQQLLTAIRSVLSRKQPQYDEVFRIVRPDGEIRHVRSSGRIYASDIDNNPHFAGVLHDVTEQTMQHEALQNEQQTLQSILNNAPIGIWFQKPDRRLLFVNNIFCKSLGISEQQFLAANHYSELLQPENASSCIATDQQALASDNPQISYETMEFVDGRTHFLEVIKVQLKDKHGVPQGLLGLSLDITDKKAVETELRHRVFIDPLTELPNRLYLMDELSKVLSLACRHNHLGALLFFDLDHFKIINDTLGHHTGDLLLKEVGCRLRRVIREEDTAARLGGDEFVIIAPDLSKDIDRAAEGARILAEKIRDSLSRAYALGDKTHHVTLSIGISLFPMDDEDVNDILKHADTAMYQAKNAGRNTIRFFLPSMQQASEDRFDMQNRLQNALHNDEFALHYQPQFDDHGNLVGAECLLRWNQQDQQPTSPAHFIPIAEESGLISDIGIWVLRESCMQLKRWIDQGYDLKTLAINVSPRQIQQINFVQVIESILKESGVDPKRLELEFTENLLIQDIEETKKKMHHLKKLGMRFAIDDFGTGFSSLNYLKKLPIDQLKIDRSFVRDITTDESSARIVETIIAMANHLKLDVIAEGVETREELNFLRRNGCYKYQGYYFSKPLGTTDFTMVLEQTKISATE